MRIVSLLPSATEIICELGLGPQLVGVSHECDYPPEVLRIPKVTSSVIPKDAPSAEIDRLVRAHLQTSRALYMLDLDLLESLRPDCIVTQALCDVCAVSSDDVEAAVCSLPGAPTVINLEPSRLEDVFDTIELVGEAAGIRATAKSKVAELKSRVAAVATRTATKIDSRPRVALLEWIDPPFNAGHWNPQLVDFAGGIDCLGNEGMPSRTLDWLEIETAAPEVLFIACCGYSLQRTLADLPILTRQSGWTKLPSTQSGRVYVFDGNAYFSRPGPRLVESLELLAHSLHPHIHPLPNTATHELMRRLRQVPVETNWNKLAQL